MRLHIRDEIFCQTPPNKLYRREMIGQIRFPEGNLIDDEYFTYRVIGNAKKLARSSACMYAYRQQQEYFHLLSVRNKILANMICKAPWTFRIAYGAYVAVFQREEQH